MTQDPGETKDLQREPLSLARLLFCVVIGCCLFRTRPTRLIGRQCPFVRAKVDPGALPRASRGVQQQVRRRAISNHSLKSLHSGAERLFPKMMNADMDAVDAENQVELEEKTRLINQVLELQHTLEDLSARVDAVKEENLKLKSENQVLGQYIENLMSASSVFQTTDTKSKRK
uniref:Short coiled-coil protein n=1 Tax=Rattus norvegicus TaxID=10116 RepID=A0A8I6GGD9_RAT